MEIYTIVARENLIQGEMRFHKSGEIMTDRGKVTLHFDNPRRLI